jgi:2-keto-3-deoxy-L-fuconate dehydrogenase
MNKRLDKKIVVVTGGGSGIGEAICLRFADEGARVAVLDINQAACERAAGCINETGGDAQAYRCDVSDPEDVKTIMEKAVEASGGLTTLVNNAGVAHIGSVEKTTPEDMDRVYRVNIKGVYNCLSTAIPILKNNNGGVIINMASVASTTGIPDRFAYSASKGAVLMMTRSVACDYLKDNIRCNSISPGRVHTPFVDRFLKDNYAGREQEMFEKLSASQPMGRMGHPEEIASLAVFLASDESAFITGVDYEIDGGFNNLKP